MQKPAFIPSALSLTALLLGLCAGAALAGTATLSGTITEAGTGTPVEGVTVISAEPDRPLETWGTVTDELGTFTFEVPMEPGQTRTLLLEAAGPDHAPGRYNGNSSTGCYFICGGADGSFAVSEGDVLTSLDLSLQPGGRFAGQVTAASNGTPLELASISAYRSGGQFPIRLSPHFDAVTDSSGNYHSPLALTPGDYHLLAAPESGTNHVQQAWQNYPCQHAGCAIFDTDTIAISAGAVTTGLDFALQSGATISGTLQPDDQPRIVRLWDGAGILLDNDILNDWSLPDADWSFNGLAGGSYYIELGGITGDHFLRQLHNGLLCPYSGCNRARGVPITIPPGSALNLSEIVLQPGGTIEGTLIDANSGTAPPMVGEGQIGSYDIIKADGTIVGGGTIAEVSGEAKLLPSAAVPAGNYYVRTFSNWFGEGLDSGYNASIPGYNSAMYPNVACAGQGCDISAAQTVTVTDGTSTNITIEISTGSSISGVVRDDVSDDPMGQVLIKLIDAAGSMLAAVRTDEHGEFSFGAFPAGDYYLRTSTAGLPGPGVTSAPQHRYFDHLYGGPARCSEMRCDPQSGTAITLDGSTDAGPMTLRIQPGPVISGQITAVLTDTLLTNGWVEVYDDSGAFVGEYRINPTNGRYQTTALAPGDYTLVPVISPAFAGVTVSQSQRSLPSNTTSGHPYGSMVVTIGTEDVDANLLMVDKALDKVFQDTFD